MRGDISLKLKDFIKFSAEKAANYDLKNLSPSKKVREEGKYSLMRELWK